MSNSRSHKQLLSVLLAVVLASSAGCGADRSSTDEKPTGSVGVVTGQTGAGASEQAAEPARPAPTSETDLVPVDIELEDGSFAKSTPKKIHVPSEFLVLISVTSGDGGPYSLSVLSPSSAQTFKIASNSSQNITQDGLAAGKQIKLMLGGKTVRIVADADPGP